MLKFIKALLISLITVALGLIITLDAENMLNAVKDSIDTCLYTIIPSLFGFMAISTFFMKSGLYRFIFKPFYLILRLFIRLNEEEFSVFLLSLIGGYPVGAKLISDECGKNPESSLARILPFCYCGSPVFIITIAGIGIFGRVEIGLIVYLSNVLANILACSFYSFMSIKKYNGREITPASISGGFFFRNKRRDVIPRPVETFRLKIIKNPADKKINLNQETFINSVMSAASSLFPVCVMIIVFGIIIEVFNFCGAEILFSNSGFDKSFFYGFLEISKLTGLKDCGIEFLPLVSALTSFGGCCILFQVIAITGSKVKLKGFMLSRIPIAVLSSIICFFISQYVKIPLEVLSVKPVIMPTETGNPTASLALLAMSALLLISSRKNKPVIIKFNK